MKKEFTVDDTKIIKGLAIIMMLSHHLWAFPERIYGGSLKYLFSLFDQSSIMYLGIFNKLCVAIFFFLGGYGTYLSSNKKNFDLFSKIKKIYVAYWKIFLIFIPIGYLFFSNQIQYASNPDICTVFSTFSYKNLINNFLGISASLNGEWWFLFNYVVALCTFPFIKRIIDKRSLLHNFGLILIFTILTTSVFPSIGAIEEFGNLNNNIIYSYLFCASVPYISCFWMGTLFAKGNLLVRLTDTINRNIKLNLLIDIVVLFVISYLHNIIYGNIIDFIIVPIFIVIVLDLVDRFKIIKMILLNIGKESTNMWLIHSFYCYYFFFFVKIVVWPRWAILSLIILILLSYFSSKIISYFWKFIAKLYHFIINQSIYKKLFNLLKHRPDGIGKSYEKN